MSSKTYNWPRMYLLGLYRDTIEHGHIIVERVYKDQAFSLKMALYRLRRRSDAANKTIILPEYHLVTAGEWVPNPNYHQSQPDYPEQLLGDMPILYNTVPEGQLPVVRDASTGLALPGLTDPHLHHTEPILPATTPTAPLDFSPEAMTIGAEDISSFVAKMRKTAEQRDD